MIVPKRPFGKTGEDVSILSLGGVLKISDQLVFRQAFKLGVTYWDTDNWYGWGCRAGHDADSRVAAAPDASDGPCGGPSGAR